MKALEFSKKYSHAFKKVTNTLFKQTKFSYFAYNRVYSGGKSFGLYSDNELVEQIFSKGMGISYVDKEGVVLPAGTYLGRNIPFYVRKFIGSPLVDDYFSNLPPKLQDGPNTNSGVLMINKQSHYDEIYFFNSNICENHAPAFYLNHQKTMQNFICYFRYSNDKILTEGKNYRTALPLLKSVKDPFCTQSFIEIDKIGFCISLPFGDVKLGVRESMCLRFLAQGHPNREIAERMILTVKTIENYVEKLKNKLNCRSRADLAKLFQESMYARNFMSLW